MPSLAEYLFFLAAHPQALERHNADKHAARDEMDKFGLSPEQQAIMLRGDSKEIKKEAEAEYQGFDRVSGLKIEIPSTPFFIRHDMSEER